MTSIENISDSVNEAVESSTTTPVGKVVAFKELIRRPVEASCDAFLPKPVWDKVGDSVWHPVMLATQDFLKIPIWDAVTNFIEAPLNHGLIVMEVLLENNFQGEVALPPKLPTKVADKVVSSIKNSVWRSAQEGISRVAVYTVRLKIDEATRNYWDMEFIYGALCDAIEKTSVEDSVLKTFK